ncbi:MAG: SHOCT domain-containing protein [Nitrosomonadales bacterium]|nr:SHOCT domain-containing protein [Nitrosomonadales bacterium]
MMNNGAGSWMMGGMWLSSILFWILIIAGVVLIVRWLTERDGQVKISQAESPLNILKTRYAKGEIDKETFEAMKRDIGVRDNER